jgi:Uncharacterized alpha/beta hydrolase domain (DUF2235)
MGDRIKHQEIKGGVLAEPKRLALFLDGTWNTNIDNTNVWRLRSLCQNDNEQKVYYSKGVGTDWWDWLTGGGFGLGLDAEVTSAYQWIVENYDDGDRMVSETVVENQGRKCGRKNLRFREMKIISGKIGNEN